MRLVSIFFSLILTVFAHGALAETTELNAVPYCSANGFAGSTVESAIAACMSSGFNAYLCGRGVTCSPGMPMCTAQGFAGTTIESAIYICRQAGFDGYICGRNVVCN